MEASAEYLSLVDGEHGDRRSDGLRATHFAVECDKVTGVEFIK